MDEHLAKVDEKPSPRSKELEDRAERIPDHGGPSGVALGSDPGGGPASRRQVMRPDLCRTEPPPGLQVVPVPLASNWVNAMRAKSGFHQSRAAGVVTRLCMFLVDQQRTRQAEVPRVVPQPRSPGCRRLPTPY